ncbi:phosphotransferase [Nocardioides rotundus]|nr:phosphotransferase [Nocardioides rotundus]
MLWEATDPQRVLSERFGFGGGGEAAAWVIETLDRHRGIRVDAVERIVMSDHNALAWLHTDAGRLLAKWSVAPDRFARLAALARLTSRMGERGVPVSVPLTTIDGHDQLQVAGVSLGVQRVVDGALLDVADEEQVRSAGVTLARLHDALAADGEAASLPGLGEPRSLVERVGGWLERSAHAPEAPYSLLGELLADAPPDDLPTQVVHGDYRAANVLCSGSSVVAVLDFEEARLDHRVDELARSAVLLGTRFHDWGPVSADVRAGFLAGYQSVRRLSDPEQAWWRILVLWYSLAMIPAGEDPTGWRTAALGLATERR